MKDIIIILLIISLIITIFYLILLKKSLKKLNRDLDKKIITESNVLLTTDVSDKDLCKLIKTINNTLKEYTSLKNEYENKNSNLRKMMTNISHDLRTPLTSALGYIDILLKTSSNPKDIKNLKIIEERLKRLSELINSFFEFSKIISNDEEIKVNKVNLVKILENSISNHYEDFSNDKRVINLNISKPKINILSNEMMLMRIFDNLIRNSYKHSKGNLDIKVEINNNIVITFTNDLLNKNLDTERIFDEFYTVDIARTKGNTGLGLAIVKEFVKELGGTITASKKENKLIMTITFDK